MLTLRHLSLTHHLLFTPPLVCVSVHRSALSHSDPSEEGLAGLRPTERESIVVSRLSVSQAEQSGTAAFPLLNNFY